MRQRETTHAERVEMVERHRAGEAIDHIAQSLNRSKYTVRHWWRAYRDGDWAALEPQPKGPPMVGPLGHFDRLVKYVALRLKREHPTWGTAILRLHMQRRPSLQGHRLPKGTALWSYLHQFGPRLIRPRRPRTKRPASPSVRAHIPHQCWQMDFKGDEEVSGCQAIITPLALSDEASGAPLARLIHSLRAKGNRQGLTFRQVQADLRQVFTQWGLPDTLRMDRDPLFVGSSRLDWPGTLLLWLVGLGVQPIINRAYRPTDNAMVERSHRTWKSDVLVGARFVDLVALQTRSDRALKDRRLYLPSRHRGCQDQPPAVAFPQLMRRRRPYDPQRERALFDLRRVDRYLAQWGWRRRVDSVGKISLANRNHHVGSRYRGQVVKIHFDSSTREFVCCAVPDTEIARFPLAEASLDYILGEGV